VDLTFWLKSKSTSHTSFLALASVDWPDVQRQAAEFLHPSVRVASLTRSERTVIPGAATAWSVLHYYKASAQIRFVP
jgi:hypothetical protein